MDRARGRSNTLHWILGTNDISNRGGLTGVRIDRIIWLVENPGVCDIPGIRFELSRAVVEQVKHESTILALFALNPGDKMVDEQAEDGIVLVHQYRGVMAMIQQNYSRRTATNRFYISIGSALLVFLTYAVNPSVNIEIQSVAATMVAVVGLVLCLVWGLQIRALRGLIDIQIKLAQEMEQSLPFDFFCRQEKILKRPRNLLKYGVVEQGLPVLMSLPYLLILGVVYF
jgi:hypothetical protein